MIRNIIHIDEDKCTGCGICALACHEGAIDIIDGKAKLVRENFCDGFGDCLPSCPAGAITFEEREAPAYDEAAVKEALSKRKSVMEHIINTTEPDDFADAEDSTPFFEMYEGGCPGSRFAEHTGANEAVSSAQPPARQVSRLAQWPCQIRLLPAKTPFYNGAKLLIAADCTAYAYANMHEDFMKDRVTLIGCPKLDDVDYTEKLTQIISENDVKSVTIVRMEVPCCGGLQRAAEEAVKASGKFLPWRVVVIATDGRILSD